MIDASTFPATWKVFFQLVGWVKRILKIDDFLPTARRYVFKPPDNHLDCMCKVTETSER